jgi:4,5-DOPA dioxygenase extradiol
MFRAMTQPVYFVSHGAPDIVLKRSAAHDFLAGLDIGASSPAAILVVSAHWETDAPRVSAAVRPETIHDFGPSFGPALFAQRYPAPGAPAMARRVADVLGGAGLPVEIDPDRGLDHGAWTPLTLMRPQADLPVLQVSIQPDQGVEGALALGRALAPLRDEGVLILASGALTHNLRAVDWSESGAVAPWARAFADWTAERISVGDLDALRDYRRIAPEAARNHPTDEHLLPLYVAVGAGGLDGAERLHASFTYGSLAMDVYRFGANAPQRSEAQKRWMRAQASSSTSVEVA